MAHSFSVSVDVQRREKNQDEQAPLRWSIHNPPSLDGRGKGRVMLNFHLPTPICLASRSALRMQQAGTGRQNAKESMFDGMRSRSRENGVHLSALLTRQAGEVRRHRKIDGSSGYGGYSGHISYSPHKQQGNSPTAKFFRFSKQSGIVG